MSDAKEKKIVKTIKIDVDKCHGCRACEMICSAFHASPSYSSINPARSRIRIVRDPLRDIYVPVYAGEYTVAECAGRDKYTIDGKEYDECSFCRASNLGFINDMTSSRSLRRSIAWGSPRNILRQSVLSLTNSFNAPDL